MHEDLNKQLNLNYKSDDEIDWFYISEYLILSDEFIEKFQDNVYESTCDCTNEENSFGLNVGTRDYAKWYASKNSIIVKCKVRYEDVGRIVHKGEKVRCFRIEILD